ncbi:LysR family transcriptional regulator [Brevibacterium permense]|uniref:LysR substrate-binding domain-containing protein n=1 Tax=Brevibacterium permense TaxID=234834 RepID=UPI0021CFCD12|nr:LysR substrate-binding domain-containing protein [Brevibacterium permense]MCU4296173.1 LysR family transcriptional regulator [Brevibacterium permense]
MELRHLRYFLAVAEERHFGRAAERLHIAQPPLSSQIKQLEMELETTLFERTTRKVELTGAGALLMERARQILSDVDAAEFDVAEVGRGAAGVLRVGFSGTATYRLMPEIVRLAQADMPNVRMQISGEMLTPQMESGLLENRLDVAILRPPVQSPELTIDEFERTPLVAVLPREHPLVISTEHDQPLSIGQLSECDLVSYPRKSAVASVVWEMCRQSSFRPRIVQEATETSTLIALVSAGLGIALVPGSDALPLHGAIAIRQLSEHVAIGLGTSWRNPTQALLSAPKPLLSSFADLVRRAALNLKESK